MTARKTLWLRLSLALTLGTLPAVGPAFAAPPPPPPPGSGPPGSEGVIDGYRMNILYSLWAYWVDRHRAEAVKTALAAPEALEGERPWGVPVMGYEVRWEGGASRGDLRRYCSTASILNPLTPDGCHFRFRFASVPDLTVGGSQPNPVSTFMREAFDPQGLARHLKASGLGPDTDWWLADGSRVFAGMPNPLPVLVANTRVQVADSRTCPALLQALEAADQRPFTTRMDFDGAGRDERGGPPAPHAAYRTYWLNINAPGVMGALRIEGGGDKIANHLLPIIRAADSCKK